MVAFGGFLQGEGFQPAIALAALIVVIRTADVGSVSRLWSRGHST